MCTFAVLEGDAGVKECLNICEHSVPTRMVYLGHDLISWALYQIYELSLSKPLEGCLVYIIVNNLISSSLSVSAFHTYRLYFNKDLSAVWLLSL